MKGVGGGGVKNIKPEKIRSSFISQIQFKAYYNSNKAPATAALPAVTPNNFMELKLDGPGAALFLRAFSPGP